MNVFDIKKMFELLEVLSEVKAKMARLEQENISLKTENAFLKTLVKEQTK